MADTWTGLKEALRSFLVTHLTKKTRQRIKKIFFLGKKIKYDAVAQWAIQDEVCNLKCVYCRFSHSIKEVPPADPKFLLETLDKTGKIFIIAICGNGETFLVPNIIEVLQELTRKHLISLVSNFTLKKTREFCEKIDPKKVTSVVASLHIKELERTGLTNRFVENYLLCKKKGFNVRAQVVAHPALLGEAEKYIKFFGQKGVQIYFDECFIEYEGKSYPDAYTDHERQVLGLIKKQESIDRIYQKGKLCNAGYNICTVAVDGKVYPCPDIKEVIGDIHQGRIEFKKELTLCPNDRCLCPLNFLSYDLFTRGLEETKKRG